MGKASENPGGLRSPRPGRRADATAPTRGARAAPSWRSRIRARPARTRGSGGPSRDARTERDARLAGSRRRDGTRPGRAGVRQRREARDPPGRSRAKHQTTAAPSEQQEHGKPEHPAPRQPGDHERRRRVGDDRGETGGAVEQAVRPAALARRPPRRDEPARRREAHRLRAAVQGPRNRERPEAAARSSPSQFSAQEVDGAQGDQAAPAGPVREVPAHDLRGAVDDEAGAADPADLGGAQPELGADPRDRPAEVLTTGVVDEVAGARREEHPPLRAAERRGGRPGRVYARAPGRRLNGPRARRRAPAGTAARTRSRRARAHPPTGPPGSSREPRRAPPRTGCGRTHGPSSVSSRGSSTFSIPAPRAIWARLDRWAVAVGWPPVVMWTWLSQITRAKFPGWSVAMVQSDPRFMRSDPSPSRQTTRTSRRASAIPSPIDEHWPIEPNV